MPSILVAAASVYCRRAPVTGRRTAEKWGPSVCDVSPELYMHFLISFSVPFFSSGCSFYDRASLSHLTYNIPMTDTETKTQFTIAQSIVQRNRDCNHFSPSARARASVGIETSKIKYQMHVLSIWTKTKSLGCPRVHSMRCGSTDFLSKTLIKLTIRVKHVPLQCF